MLKILRIMSSVAFVTLIGACATSSHVQTAVNSAPVQTAVKNDSCFETKAECLEYVRKVAERGDAEAQYKLGFMYLNGVGLTVDKHEGVRWYRLSAEQGDSGMQYLLGVMYEKGNGVAMDKSEAARWYRLAAEQGDVLSQKNLDVLESLESIRENAEQGNVEAQFNLGEMYRTGEGLVAVNGYEAVRWYQLAAEQGYERAQYKLGFMYQIGIGIVEDMREAARWYRLAAEQGNTIAQYNLGGIYEEGKGVIQDEREAYIWYLIAQASGREKLDERLRIISIELTVPETKLAKLEAKQRFEKIKSRKGDVQNADNSASQNADNSAQKNGEEFAIAKPPEETNIAAVVFENTWRSVVMIKNAEGQGSGVIIRPNLVATNCHVIEGGGVSVYKPENRRINENAPFSAKVIYRKEDLDFCILEVNELWGIPATIRKYDTLKIGENVYALGAPRGLDLSLSNGLISQLRTDDSTRFIQTDAAISPGSSGGGLFDTKGSFIGILTSKYVGEDVEGIGFAIPADLVLEF